MRSRHCESYHRGMVDADPHDQLFALELEQAHRAHVDGAHEHSSQQRHSGWLGLLDSLAVALSMGLAVAMCMMGFALLALWSQATAEEQLYLVLIFLAVGSSVAALYLTKLIDLSKAESPRMVKSVTALIAQLALLLLLGLWAMGVAA